MRRKAETETRCARLLSCAPEPNIVRGGAYHQRGGNVIHRIGQGIGWVQATIAARHQEVFAFCRGAQSFPILAVVNTVARNRADSPAPRANNARRVGARGLVQFIEDGEGEILVIVKGDDCCIWVLSPYRQEFVETSIVVSNPEDAQAPARLRVQAGRDQFFWEFCLRQN